MGVEVPRELHRRRAARPGGAEDEDPRALPNVGRAQAREALQEPVAHRGRLLERGARRLVRERPRGADADVLRVRAEPAGGAAEDLVPDGEPVGRSPEGLHLPGELDAEDLLLRSQEPGEEPPDEGARATDVAVGLRDRRRANPDEDLVVGRDGRLDLVDPQDVRRPVAVVDDGPHAPALAVPVERDDDLAPRMPLSDVLERVGDLAELVPPVDRPTASSRSREASRSTSMSGLLNFAMKNDGLPAAERAPSGT